MSLTKGNGFGGIQGFSEYRDVFSAKGKHLKQAEKGLNPTKSLAFTNNEIKILWGKIILGDGLYSHDNRKCLLYIGLYPIHPVLSVNRHFLVIKPSSH